MFGQLLRERLPVRWYCIHSHYASVPQNILEEESAARSRAEARRSASQIAKLLKGAYRPREAPSRGTPRKVESGDDHDHFAQSEEERGGVPREQASQSRSVP